MVFEAYYIAWFDLLVEFSTHYKFNSQFYSSLLEQNLFYYALMLLLIRPGARGACRGRAPQITARAPQARVNFYTSISEPTNRSPQTLFYETTRQINERDQIA